MAKLKCDKHKRRVVTSEFGMHFLHRNGDGSKCTSKTATIKDNTFTAQQIVDEERDTLDQDSTDKLLREIFGAE